MVLMGFLVASNLYSSSQLRCSDVRFAHWFGMVYGNRFNSNHKEFQIQTSAGFLRAHLAIPDKGVRICVISVSHVFIEWPTLLLVRVVVCLLRLSSALSCTYCVNSIAIFEDTTASLPRLNTTSEDLDVVVFAQSIIMSGLLIW